MVQIFITKENNGDLSEWNIIELQGDLESKLKSSLSECFVGDLHFTENHVPVLIIGHHILYGKAVDMEKPLAVLIKKKLHVEECNTLKDLHRCKPNIQKSTAEYLVRAVIKKKLIFKTRPKPIISNIPKKI